MARQIKFGDKLLLAGETLILDNGPTNDGVIKSKSGTIKIDGNLTVSGVTTTIESETVTIADNILLINSNVTGTPTESGGIEIERGTETNVQFFWEESADRWTTGAQTFHAGAIITPMLTGDITGNLTGDVTSPGTSTFSSIDVNGGNIDGTVIGASSSAAGTFSTITGALTGTVSSIANHDTDDLAEGSTNLYYTQARVDARYATLHNNADAGTLDGQDGLYYLDYTNFTNTPTTITSLANHSIDALSDVDTTTVAPVSGETIIWNGTNWIPGDSFSQADFNTAFTAKDTDDLSEGTTNLYYTDARARASINATGSLNYNSSTGVISYTQGNTDTVAEGSTNLYYTTARANTDFDTRLATKSTTNLAEGTNLYYTDARVQAVSINDIVEDTTPQLGGNLDLNTFDLSTTDPTVTLTTTTTPSLTQGTVAASTDTNLSNTTVAFLDDTGNISTATSAYTTLTSTEIDNLGFKGDISLTYFGAAAISSNFVWRDVSDSAEQNDMITVYAPPSDEYTFTLPHETLFQIDSTDNDIYFKQYAYGEMTVTTTSTLTGSNIQLRDSNGFYIDKEHVTVTNTSGNDYKIVFWTHDATVGEVIDVVSPSAQTAIFEWGTETFSEPGFTMSAESFSLQSSTNDLFAMGDLDFTDGLTTGEIVGTFIFDHPTGSSIISGLTTVTIDGTSYLSTQTITDVPIIMTANAGTSNELGLAVGSPTDARLRLQDSSGDLIYKFPAADGTANQVMKTDGSGDISWTTLTTDDIGEGSTNLYYTDARWNTKMAAASTSDLSEGTNLYYTDARVATKVGTMSTTDLSEGTNLYYTDTRADARAQLKIDALVDSAPGTLDTLNELAAALGDDANHVTTMTNLVSANTTLIGNLTHDGFADFVANEHIDWTADQGATNIHAGNYTDTNTTYVDSDWNHDNLTGFVANEHIDWTAASAGTIDPSNYTNTGNTTYTAGTGLTLVGTEFRNTAQDQTVSLTGTGATTVTGTYPNFTIDSTNSTTDITGSIIPATDNTYDLGSTTKKYANIYGYTVEATYADIAERYATDVPYEEGTVVVFGGESEITTTTEPGDVSVAGVISTNPALKLNADAGNSQTHPYVALKGRVPCKIIGPVSKGDLIVTAHNEPGYAQSIGKNDAGHSVFAKSIETDLTDGKKLIEVSIL